jgi:amidophosphoribosyltransferase
MSWCRGAFSRQKFIFSDTTDGSDQSRPKSMAMLHLLRPVQLRGWDSPTPRRAIKGSCSILLLTDKGILRRSGPPGAHAPGDRPPCRCAWRSVQRNVRISQPGTSRSGSLSWGPVKPFLSVSRWLASRCIAPGDRTCRSAAFLWIYYGYPASEYEGINVEVRALQLRGHALAHNGMMNEVDLVAGIPGFGHRSCASATPIANAGLPYRRPFVKYTPTWSRSFMPQDQSTRDLVARMKIIPIRELIQGRRLLFCEDSIVRGTQLKDHVQSLFRYGNAREVHMRPGMSHANSIPCIFHQFFHFAFHPGSGRPQSHSAKSRGLEVK